MAPAQPPPQGDLPILEQEEGIMIIFFVFCLAMVCAVYWGERRPLGEDSKGKGIESEETTPLLSPESTLLGSDAEGSSTNKSDRSASVPSVTTYGSVDSSPTSGESHGAL
jgi:hypothetical protein